MAIYLVERTDDVEYDEYSGLVVRAKSEKEALAYATRSEYGYPVFTGITADGSNLKISRVDVSGETGVVLSNYRAG